MQSLYTHDPDLELFRDNFRRFLAEHIAPHYPAWEEQGIMPREVWHQLGQNGFLCIDLPEEYGGVGVPVHYSMMLVEEAARAGFGSLSTAISVHSEIVTPYILHIGTPEQKEKYLPKMASGEMVGAIGMTEPGAGSDLQAIRTTAILKDSVYVVNGSKTFISNGQHADLVIMAVKTDPAQGAKGVSLLIIETALEGFSKGTNLDKIGLRSQDTSELFMTDVNVPQNNLLGQAGSGFAYMMQELPRERLGICFTALGAILGALDVTTTYLHERKAFGQAIAKFQTVRHALAGAKIEALAVESLTRNCVQAYERGELDVPTVAAAKAYTTDMQCKIIDSLLQLFGGYGYMTEYPISRFYVDARVQRIYGGTNEIMKEIVSRDLLGR